MFWPCCGLFNRFGSENQVRRGLETYQPLCCTVARRNECHVITGDSRLLRWRENLCMWLIRQENFTTDFYFMDFLEEVSSAVRCHSLSESIIPKYLLNARLRDQFRLSGFCTKTKPFSSGLAAGVHGDRRASRLLHRSFKLPAPSLRRATRAGSQDGPHPRLLQMRPQPTPTSPTLGATLRLQVCSKFTLTHAVQSSAVS